MVGVRNALKALILVADRDLPRPPFVGHREVLKKRTAQQCDVWLPPSTQAYSRESSVERAFECWDMDLSKVHINSAEALSARNSHLVDYRQPQLRGKCCINAAAEGSCIHQCLLRLAWQRGNSK